MGAAVWGGRGGAEEGNDANGEVVTVDEGDVVEGLPRAGLEGEFGEGGGRLTGAPTYDGAAAVPRSASLAWSIVGRCSPLDVETAVCPPPDPSLPVGADGLGLSAVRCQAETGGGWASACLGLDGGIDILFAMVCDGEGDVRVTFVDPLHGRPAHVVVGMGEVDIGEGRSKEE